jgi:hypothetical protein
MRIFAMGRHYMKYRLMKKCSKSNLKDSNDNSEKIPGSIPFGSNVPVATRAI